MNTSFKPGMYETLHHGIYDFEHPGGYYATGTLLLVLQVSAGALGATIIHIVNPSGKLIRYTTYDQESFFGSVKCMSK